MNRLAGFLCPLLTPELFITSQLPTPTLPLVSSDATTRLLAVQLGNAYLLLGFLGLFILNTTTEIKVVRAYLWALWLGDIGHVGFTLWAIGWEGTLDVEKWSAVTWGNIGITAFLFAMRCAYLGGLFERRSRRKTEVKKRKAVGGRKKKA
jgi:hypothetical protein